MGHQPSKLRVAGSSPAGRAIKSASLAECSFDNNGGRSSVGRALDCDSGGRGFEPHRPPHFLEAGDCLYWLTGH